MSDPATDSLLARLQTELGELGIHDVGAAVLDELGHALRRQAHEGTLPGYGAVVLTTDQAARTGTTAGRTEFEDAERLRQLADGHSSFVERIGDEVSLWLARGPVTERELVATCRERGASVVRLDPTGDLHLLGADRIWTRRRAQWNARPTAPALLDRLRAHDGMPGDVEVLGGLLDLVAHVLGPREVGATLVWLPDWQRTGCEASLPAGGSTPLLSLRERAHDGAITNLLRQHDGATLVSPGGALWWVGAELRGTAVATEPITPPVGGMRHRSAARFSRRRPDAWVFVVSHDGPVSVFVGGDDVTRPR